MQKETFVNHFPFVMLFILVVFSVGLMVGKTKYYYIYIFMKIILLTACLIGTNVSNEFSNPILLLTGK